jgi:hypothetical protein
MELIADTVESEEQSSVITISKSSIPWFSTLLIASHTYFSWLYAGIHTDTLGFFGTLPTPSQFALIVI